MECGVSWQDWQATVARSHSRRFPFAAFSTWQRSNDRRRQVDAATRPRAQINSYIHLDLLTTAGENTDKWQALIVEALPQNLFIHSPLIADAFRNASLAYQNYAYAV